MRTQPVTVTETGDHLDVECSVCHMSVRAPNKGFGRALVAAFKTQHQHGA